MKKFLLSDVAASYLGGRPFRETFELKFYDFRSSFLEHHTQPNEVAITAIDDDRIAQLGRWPWRVHA